MTAEEIRNEAAESGVVASVLMKPEFTFLSENLRPEYFTIRSNAYIYNAVCGLAQRGLEKVDPYAVFNQLNTRPTTRVAAESEHITPASLQELFDVAKNIARETKEAYIALVDDVINAAFRRDTFRKLAECQRLCLQYNEKDIEKKIYSVLDDVMAEFSVTNVIPEYKDVIDGYWQDIERRQDPESAGAIPFKFPTLNEYVMIERGELVIFGAEQKQGKSMLLLNCATDLLRRGQRILYLDSELNSRLFTCRIISHLTGIEFRRVRSGGYTEEERERIMDSIEWLKQQSFTHLYMPIFDEQSIYATIKRVSHTQGIDALIVDYFKGGDDKDAFASYQSLGGLVNMVKNDVCGAMNIAGIGAAQANSAGRLADSAKIARNASTIIMLEDKTPEEIQQDGRECGNKKLFVRFNRNGPQHNDGEYIDLLFNGDKVLYEEAKQHVQEAPF